MNLIRFKTFLRNHFVKIHFKSAPTLARCTLCSAPALSMSDRQVGHGSHTSTTTEGGENSGEPELIAADPFRRTKYSYAFYGSRRTR